ncbi:hypothetical protein D3C76_653950 [compost metagenome]
MKAFGPNMLYAFAGACALLVIWRVRPEKVTGLHRVDEAPLHHVPTPDSMASSPFVAALDPRVGNQAVAEQMKGSEAPVPEAEEESRPA